MRIRKKPNLIPRMARCIQVQIEDPAALKSEWLKRNPDYAELWLELGCGKGRFTADTAEQNPQALLVAVEKVPEVIIIAMERAADKGLKNVRFIDTDVLALPVIFGQDEVDRIYLNFSDPWPKSRDAKHRLTSPGFLEIYESVLKPEGEIHFKTDNRPLFEYSVETLEKQGWMISELNMDLHAEGVVGVMTDYEAKFYEQGVRINRLVAKKERCL